MAKKEKKPVELNRNKYNDIKRMDHTQMEGYLNEIYEKGMAAGQARKETAFDMNLCLESIAQIKGIGATKLEHIKLAMMAAGAKEQ